MARHRSHSIEFKRRVAQKCLAGETLHGLAKRHDISRNLIRLWVQRYQAGVFDGDAAARILRDVRRRVHRTQLIDEVLRVVGLVGAQGDRRRPIGARLDHVQRGDSPGQGAFQRPASNVSRPFLSVRALAKIAPPIAEAIGKASGDAYMPTVTGGGSRCYSTRSENRAPAGCIRATLPP